MNLITLADVLPIARRFVDNGAGSCDYDTLLSYVNEACKRLIVKADWKHTVMLVRARVDKDMFPLPRELESIRAVNVDNEPSHVAPMTFRFMSAGPGEEQSWWDGRSTNVDEAGWYPTMYDLPSIEYPNAAGVNDVSWASTGLHLMAFSDKAADATKYVSIRGRDKNNTPIGVDSTVHTPDEQIRIVAWDNGVEGALTGTLEGKPMSAQVYRSLTSWTKPATAGHISLYAVEPSTYRMWFLAKAHPHDTAPTWRRYKFRSQSCCGSNVLILGKIAAEDLRSTTDIMPIQNLAAVKNMLMAISAENAGELRKALEYEAQATRLLVEEKIDSDSQGFSVQVIDHDVDIANCQTNRYYSR